MVKRTTNHFALKGQHNRSIHKMNCPFRATLLLIPTRRVAAGWLMLPFQGEYLFNLKQKFH
jgi:hypothetical protein